MMPLDRTIDMTDRVNAADVFPPAPQGQLLRTSAALTSSPMPEPAVEYVLTLRERHVQLMTSGYLSRLCMRLSTWLYKTMGY
jgi:hypothetical protein